METKEKLTRNPTRVSIEHKKETFNETREGEEERKCETKCCY